jgi:hypothetical protein
MDANAITMQRVVVFLSVQFTIISEISHGPAFEQVIAGVAGPGHARPEVGEGHAGHGGHDQAMMIADFRKRFWVVLVLTGAANGNGALRVEVAHGAKDSYLSQVVQLVKDAWGTKSKTQLLADKAARSTTLSAGAAA